MRLETLLPLGKVDPGLRTPDIPLDITTVADNARLLEAIGYGGMVGLDDVSERAQLLLREQRWEELPDLISDEILDRFAVIGIYDEIGRKIFERWGNNCQQRGVFDRR